jgi:hypothetical protein
MRSLFLTMLPTTALLLPPAAPVERGFTDAAAETTINIVARIGKLAIPVYGPGQCNTSSESTIYGVPATQWHGVFDGPDSSDLEHVNVTVWQPKAGGPDQVTLYLTVAGTTHRISTVKGGESLGRATASARRQGTGGTLLVDGTSADGTAIHLEFICDEFSEIVEGNG